MIVLLAFAGVVEASLSVPGDRIDVGNVGVGANGTTTAVIATNSVTGDVLDHFDASGAACAHFTLTPASSLPRLITIATPLNVVAGFAPTARGQLICTVTMRSAANASLGTFVLRGTGQAAEIAAANPPSFGPVRVTGGSATRTVTIANAGDPGTTLQLQALGVTGDYEVVTPPALPVAIAAGASLDLTVRFDPTLPGTRPGALDIMSDDPLTPIATVELTGQGTSAQIAVTDAAFGIVTLQQTVTRTLTVSNTAATNPGPLRVASAAITGGAGWFRFDANGAFACAGATACAFGPTGTDVPPALAVVVRCTPPAGASGTMTATVDFTSDSDPGGDASAALTCTAGRADASIVPTTLAFPDTRVGQTSAAKTVTVTNTGTEALTFTATPSGAQAAAYALTDCTASCTVAPNGGTRTFDVTFSPLADVASNITIDIDSNDPDDPHLTIAVTGRGIAPRITAPATVPFGSVEVPQTSAPQSLTVMNTGTATLTITNASFGGATPGAYAVATGTLGAQTTLVGPGASTTWGIRCHPVQQAANNATFVIASDALGTPATTVNLTCNGTQGVLVVNPTSIDFGGVAQGTSQTRSYTLRNTGNLAVSVITGVLGNATLGYSLDPATPVPTTLAAGQTATLNVIFAPQIGNAGGATSVAFSGIWGAVPTATTATLALAGVGLTAGFDVSPAALAFGNVRFDQTATRTFCIVNTDQAAVTIANPIAIAPTAPTATGEFTVSRVRRQTACGTGGTDVTLPQTLTTNQVLEVTVRAAPANRTGPMAATLTVTSNLAQNPTRTVALTGTATSGTLALAPGATVDFGAVDVQGPAAQRTLTITNTGDAPVDLSGFARTPDNPSFTFTLPAGTTTLQPTDHVDIAISYKPTAAAPAGSEERFTITHAIAGVLGAPALGMIQVQGRGIDRVLSVVETPVFPDTFRNPGPSAPVRPVRVTNTGEATLHVTAVMITNDPEVWHLVGEDPVDVPGGGTVEFPVRFTPTAAGPAPDAFLELTHDAFDPPAPGPTVTTRVALTGNGLARRVLFAPTDIDLGFTSIGVPITLAGALSVTSMDDAITFTIREIAVDDARGVFAIDDTPAGVELAPAQTRTYGVTFTPTTEGDFTATAALFLDDDTAPQATIRIRGRAVSIDARGGGGCSTTSGGGLLPLALAALAVLLVRRRRHRGALAAAAVVTVTTGVAVADNVVLSTFDPTPATTTTGFQLQSAEVGADGDWVATAVLSHATRPLILGASIDGTFINDDAVVARSTMIELGGAYAFLDRFEVGARMPLYMQGGDALGDPDRMFTTAPARSTAAGDLTLHAKVAAWKREGLAVASAFALTLPTASDGAFTGNEGASARVFALGTYLVPALDGRITVSANAGAVLRKRAQVGTLEQKSGLAWGLGASARVRDRVWVAAEMFGEAAPSASGLGHTLAPSEWLGGVRVRLDRKLDLGVALGRGLTSAAGSPALRGVVQLSFAPNARALPPLSRGERPDVDSDGDGILDRADRCPHEPEDKDGFQDDDGCPDLDNDGDGIPDAQDKCPNEPETINGNKDDDGCPDAGDGAVVVSPDRLELLDPIQWNGAKIGRNSLNVLGQVGATLRAHPEILRMRIAVHIPPGNDPAKDQELSEKRAQALREWLVQWGVAEARLEARGFGGEQPLVPRTQPGSQAINERIDLIILEKK
ncbi:MAG: choice-of-anchor D domain-containing protein [Deltaproteobacteria bacterium]|nr:choice-of-anchor D domain-containing protein [Deltaproteobacteria bacterium]